MNVKIDKFIRGNNFRLLLMRSLNYSRHFPFRSLHPSISQWQTRHRHKEVLSTWSLSFEGLLSL